MNFPASMMLLKFLSLLPVKYTEGRNTTFHAHRTHFFRFL